MQEELVALRRENELLQQTVTRTAPQMENGTPFLSNGVDLSRNLGPGWAWRNSGSEHAAQDGQPVSPRLGSVALGAQTSLHNAEAADVHVVGRSRLHPLQMACRRSLCPGS